MNAIRKTGHTGLKLLITMLIDRSVVYFAASGGCSFFYKMPFQYAGHCYQGAEESISALSG